MSDLNQYLSEQEEEKYQHPEQLYTKKICPDKNRKNCCYCITQNEYDNCPNDFC